MENKVGQAGEDRLRKEQIIDHIPGGIAIYRIGKTVETLYFNEGVCDLHGKTREEYALGIRKNPIADVFEEDRSRVLAEAYSFISRGLPIDISYRIYHKTMPPRWVHLTAHQVQKEENAAIYAAILMDISKEHHMLDALLLRAEHDDLAGLYNRAGFKHILYQFFAKKNQTDACFVMLDIDNFKTINDAYGHTKGDEILCMLAAALEQYGDSDTVVGRLGGDEFAIFMPNIGHGEDAMLRLQNLCDATKLEIHVEEVHLSVSCSLGVCMAPEHGSDFDTLYDHADRALFATKRTDKGKFAMYDESMMNPSPILLQNMEWLLDEGSDAIYICNADTYELLYLNRVARSLFA
ncbi:MAG: sensor domain-containing diguanylate cyclase, partial [Hungatella sp.]